MHRQDNTVTFEGEKIYAGIDVHKSNWKVSIIGEHLTHKTFSQDPEPDQLHKYLTTHFPGAEYHSAYEAGFSGFWAHDRLLSLGIHSIVVNPSDIPTTDKEKRQKEDKRDSRKIARSLRNGELTPIRIPSKKNREDRSLLRVRKAVLKDLQRNKNRIKGLLFFYGIEFPERFKNNTSHWSNAFMEWLERLSFVENSGKDSLQFLINISKYQRIQLLEITRKIKNLSRSSYYAEDVALLCSVPGVGLLTSMTWLTELESMSKYEKLDHLCSYIGMVPSTHSSSDKERVGNITPRGKKQLRSLLVESAWIAARKDPALMKKYNQLCVRMKPNEAIIRIAKRLISRMRYVLINREKYKILTNS
ncbi:MAG: IS110 family transposase [Bacteroidota bacterium]